MRKCFLFQILFRDRNVHMNLLTENCTLCVCFYGRLLIDLYLLAIDAVMKGVETFSKTSDWQKVKVNNCEN